MWIIVEGNPVDGFHFYGPYEDSEEASETANFHVGQEWWITELDSFGR